MEACPKRLKQVHYDKDGPPRRRSARGVRVTMAAGSWKKANTVLSGLRTRSLETQLKTLAEENTRLSEHINSHGMKETVKAAKVLEGQMEVKCVASNHFCKIGGPTIDGRKVPKTDGTGQMRKDGP